MRKVTKKNYFTILQNYWNNGLKKRYTYPNQNFFISPDINFTSHVSQFF